MTVLCCVGGFVKVWVGGWVKNLKSLHQTQSARQLVKLMFIWINKGFMCTLYLPSMVAIPSEESI